MKDCLFVLDVEVNITVILKQPQKSIVVLTRSFFSLWRIKVSIPIPSLFIRTEIKQGYQNILFFVCEYFFSLFKSKSKFSQELVE